jgi:streptomycin 6-kinase
MNLEAEKYLQHYTGLWALVPDGDFFYTHSGLLQPVIFEGKKAIIKISKRKQEDRAAKLMLWWQGNGAAKVLKYKDPALLMERAMGTLSLSDMAANGADDEASFILSQVAEKLHSHEMKNLPELIPLSLWLKALGSAADANGDLIKKCSGISHELLLASTESVVLHGDIHHKNILHSQVHGWVAIDPKGLLGDRAFDYANIFCNPDKQTALTPGRLARQIKIVSETAALDAGRLLKWVITWAACSAIWSMNDGQDPEPALGVAQLAMNELKK